MRFMEAIRRKGHWFLIIFLIMFTITLFYGLTGGFENTGPGGSVNDRDESKAPVLSPEAGADTALIVDGRKISNNVFNQVVRLVVDNFGMRSGDDPTMMLQAYGYAMGMLVNQEVLLAYGEEHGIKLASEDWAKAKADAAASFREAQEEKKPGNIVGDAFGKLGELKAQK